MNAFLQRWPLWMQIWSVFVAFALFCLAVTTMVSPRILTHYLTDEVFTIIAHAQNEFLEMRRGGRTTTGDPAEIDGVHRGRLGIEANGFPSRVPVFRNSRTVIHRILSSTEEGQPLERGRTQRRMNGWEFPQGFMDRVQQQAQQQQASVQNYTTTFGEETLFYVIRKTDVLLNEYVFSYMWNTYLNTLVKAINQRFILLLIAVLVLCIVPSILVARYVTRPLAALAQSVLKIADRQWHDPIKVSREDEIGLLAHSIDRMRQRLKSQDEAQQRMIQHVSHELKTPVMVIQSFAQSMREGIYPHGDQASSFDVIEQESKRLQKRIHDLLYMTRLQYLANQPLQVQSFDFHEVITGVVHRFKVRRSEISWHVSLAAPPTMTGDREQWVVAIENVLDNALRYATSHIALTWEEGGAYWRKLTIENDGPPLREELRQRLFHAFSHGPDGQFGLGLAIAQRIAESHHAVLQCESTLTGVVCTYTWGKAPPQQLA